MKSASSLILALVFLCITGTSLLDAAVSAEKGRTAEKADPQVLAGKWLRPDGGYVLELRDIGKNGRLKAAYFNPRPINVHKAEWSSTKGILNVFVELRDINYPGSKYNLRYDPASDRLKGTYFQAVEQQTYEIEFVRYR